MAIIPTKASRNFVRGCLAHLIDFQQIPTCENKTKTQILFARLDDITQLDHFQFEHTAQFDHTRDSVTSRDSLISRGFGQTLPPIS
jgi:hypothetical protein